MVRLQAREKAGRTGVLNARNWTCYPLSDGDLTELVTSTSVQVDRGVDDVVDAIDDRILAAIGGGDSVEERYSISSATQLLHYDATAAGSRGAYGAHTDCHDFRGKRVPPTLRGWNSFSLSLFLSLSPSLPLSLSLSLSLSLARARALSGCD